MTLADLTDAEKDAIVTHAQRLFDELVRDHRAFLQTHHGSEDGWLRATAGAWATDRADAWARAEAFGFDVAKLHRGQKPSEEPIRAARAAHDADVLSPVNIRVLPWSQP